MREPARAGRRTCLQTASLWLQRLLVGLLGVAGFAGLAAAALVAGAHFGDRKMQRHVKVPAAAPVALRVEEASIPRGAPPPHVAPQQACRSIGREEARRGARAALANGST